MRLITFNARMWNGIDDKADGANVFINRLGLIENVMNRENADIVAFQEITECMLPIMEKIMPNYHFLGHGRNFDYGGEGLYIAVNKNTSRVLALNTFWIAPNTCDPLSKFADQSICPRICVSVKILDKATKRVYLVYNVHLDHGGKEARKKGLECVLKMISSETEKRQIPICLLGDFNEKPNSEVYAMCCAYKKIKLIDITKDIDCTFHKYGKLNSKIDYIFLSHELAENMKRVGILNDCSGGIYLSDHYPITAEIKL